LGHGFQLPVTAPRPLLAVATRKSPWLAAVRHFNSEARKSGTVKMWNEEKGFGFLSPAGGGEDVFVHRSAVGEGVVLSQGQSVSFEAVWDDKKRKDRAASVQVEAAAEGEAASLASPRASPAAARGPASSHNLVGSFGGWSIHREPMASVEDSGRVRHQITVRPDAPKGREDFQIVGNASWDLRLYPAGGDKEETVVLQPGGAGSKAADLRGKGHGRNWAVEGKPGTKFNILYDPATQMVSCENA